MASDRRPTVRAPEAAWRRLGELLQLRRAELGHRRRPSFTREHGINIRLVTDIENAYRPNTFLTPTLRDIAQAYRVTYDSVVAVLAGKADALAAAVPEETPPMAPARAGSDRAWFDEINERRVALAARGVTDPSGAQMFPGSPDDAQTWDGIGARLDIGDRVWFIADLRRRDAGRGGGSGTGTNGVLRRGPGSWLSHTSRVTLVRSRVNHIRRNGREFRDVRRDASRGPAWGQPGVLGSGRDERWQPSPREVAPSPRHPDGGMCAGR